MRPQIVARTTYPPNTIRNAHAGSRPAITMKYAIENDTSTSDISSRNAAAANIADRHPTGADADLHLRLGQLDHVAQQGADVVEGIDDQLADRRLFLNGLLECHAPCLSCADLGVNLIHNCSR